MSTSIERQQETKRCSLHRFVLPDQQVSLSDDAPGWGGGGQSSNENNDGSTTDGPICWKCRGTNLAASKRESYCKVCQGKGRLQLSKKRKRRHTITGRITGRARRNPKQDAPSRQQQNDDASNDSHNVIDKDGPMPAALQEESNTNTKWTELVRQADQSVDAIEVSLSSSTSSSTTTTETTDTSTPPPSSPPQVVVPDWIPRAGEELCCLTGQWRILQKVACHRWTTDDLVTAWMARQQLCKLLHQNDNNSNSSNNNEKFHYLDLGTGNASVLQMVLWSAHQMQMQESIQALGIEARSEAVALARRSLRFNVGKQDGQNQVRIQHADFRSFDWSGETPEGFDLITGTPPYFRVEFVVEHQEYGDNNSSAKAVVQEARIQQGGMPTAKQSAPARCEFRGGIEAYCQTAACVLKKPTGVFVVCENWKNHPRVLQAATDCHLRIVDCLPVEGRSGKGNLFAVYVMQHPSATKAQGQSPLTAARAAPLRPTLTVRDEHGTWSKEYQDSVMKDMSIPLPGKM